METFKRDCKEQKGEPGKNGFMREGDQSVKRSQKPVK